MYRIQSEDEGTRILLDAISVFGDTGAANRYDGFYLAPSRCPVIYIIHVQYTRMRDFVGDKKRAHHASVKSLSHWMLFCLLLVVVCELLSSLYMYRQRASIRCTTCFESFLLLLTSSRCDPLYFFFVDASCYGIFLI